MDARLVLATILTVALVMGVAVPSAIAGAPGEGVIVAEGFNGPQGVLVASDGTLYVVDSGVGGDLVVSVTSPETGEPEQVKIGNSARVVHIASNGEQQVIATLPSVLMERDTLGGSRLAELDGTIYVTSGGWEGTFGDTPMPNMARVLAIRGGELTELVNTWEVEKASNPDGYILESHPYDLAFGPDGRLWIADAGANDLLAVDLASKKIEVVNVFPGVPSPLSNPARGNAMESDPVPTGVAFDKAGNVYVSFLPGIPFLPGSAKVVKVASDGSVTDFATDLTTITDLQSAPDGNLYAVQFAQFTQDGPLPNTGAVIRVRQGDASEVVVSGLSFPTSIGFDAAGDAFVTINGVGAPGSGAVVKFAQLTSMAGSPLPAPVASSREATPTY